jgi:hypothetical protein
VKAFVKGKAKKDDIEKELKKQRKDSASKSEEDARDAPNRSEHSYWHGYPSPRCDVIRMSPVLACRLAFAEARK